MITKCALRLSKFLFGLFFFAMFPASVSGHPFVEDLKVVPSDGAANDQFGYSIAIDNGIIAVGARFDDDNGTASGSAYLFDAITGEQLFKLLPDDGGANDYFGVSIAISNGVVAVGAVLDDDNGLYSGSAYLFDASTGEQIAKLLPSDGEAGDYFGESVSMSNGVVAVGAPFDDDNGSLSGSAYLFDSYTGMEIVKLLPDDGEASDAFGKEICISDGVLTVGAPGDNDNGMASGSAYIFDVATSTQVHKIVPGDGSDYANFGESIAIDNGMIVVGGVPENDIPNFTGSVYLFDATTGDELMRLSRSNGSVDDRFGSAVAIDNNLVVVGGYGDTSNGDYSGSVFVFYASTGEQIAKITTSDGEEDDYFGVSVAIDNGIIAAGARRDSHNGVESGSAYVFSDPTLLLAEDHKFTAPDGNVFDSFGHSVAIRSGVIAIGSYLDDDNGVASGSAYIYKSSGNEMIAKLLPSDGAADDEFGYSIATGNGVVAVGAWRDDDNGTNSGSAYLFDSFTGKEIAKLLPNDGSARDWFGRSVSICNGIVAVGADGSGESGAAYLFESSTGEQLLKLTPADAVPGSKFGWSVAIDKDIVAVGAYLDDDNGTNSGSVYLFDPSTGEQTQKLLATDGTAGDRFGYAVSIADGVVAVGASADDDNGGSAGSAYLFDATTGAQLFKLSPSDAAPTDQFGWSVAVDKNVVVIGAVWNNDNGLNSGSAYIFDATNGSQIAKLLPTDGGVNDEFGFSVAISTGVVTVGALNDRDADSESGSAYLFDTGYVLTCLADLTGDGELDFFDISGFLVFYQIGDLNADFNDDGVLDFFDVSAFLNAFNAGCP